MKLPLRVRWRARWEARKAWFFEEDKEYRWINLAVWFVAFCLVAAVGFFVAASGCHPLTVAASVFVSAAIAGAVATPVTYLIKDDM